MAHEEFRSIKDVESLKQAFDELAVQAHLLKAEARDRWVEIEENWRKLETELDPLRKAGKHSAQEIGGAARLLAATVRDGITDIRRSLKR